MSCTARTWRSRAAPRPQARSRKGTRETRAPAKVRAARGGPSISPKTRGTQRPAQRLHDRVRDVALVGVVRPGALHRVRAIAHGHVRGRPLAGADPGALIAILLAQQGGPAARRILIGHRLGVLMAIHDGEAVEQTRGAGVDEVLAAARA